MAGGIWPKTVGFHQTRCLMDHMEEIECGGTIMDIADGKYDRNGKSKINYTNRYYCSI